MNPTQGKTAHAPGDGAADTAGKIITAMAGGLALGYAGTLAVAFKSHFWIINAAGRPVIEDFVAFWSAGALARHGLAVAAYDPHFQRAAAMIPAAHGVGGILEWSYPPLFLFVAVVLACLPFVWAFLLWAAATLALHARVVASISGRGSAFVLACAAPWTMLCTITGQDGFLTAAIIGGVLMNLESRPVLSGLLVGLLSYKPQFGLLFPVAFAFGGYRRAFFWACVATSALTALSCAVFGFDSFLAFLHRLGGTAETHLLNNDVGWSKLQSLYGAARLLGLSDGHAQVLQACLSLACAACVALLWRSRLPFALKSAGLVAAVPLATPYVFAYDLPILAVSIAFLFRHRSFDRLELLLLGSSQIAVALIGWHAWPAGLIASLCVGMLVWRRAKMASPNTTWSPFAQQYRVASN